VIRLDHDLTTNKPEVVLTLAHKTDRSALGISKEGESEQGSRGGRVGLKREALARNSNHREAGRPVAVPALNICVGPRRTHLPTDRSESRKSNNDAVIGCPNWNSLAAFGAM
jgi:hypothetical protein